MHICVECPPDLSFRELSEVKAARGLQILMSQYFLDVPHRTSTLQKRRRCRMAQDMRRYSFTKPLEHWPVRASEHSLHVVRLQSTALRTGE